MSSSIKRRLNFRKSFKNLFRLIYVLIRSIASFFSQGFRSNLSLPYFCAFYTYLRNGIGHFHYLIHMENARVKKINDDKIAKLQKTVQGLHSLLPSDPLYSYSVLICLDQPSSHYLKVSLESVLNLTPPLFNILIGYKGTPSQEIKEIIQKNKKSNPKKIEEFEFSSNEEESQILNQLALAASGNYLFIMGQEDWVRPDLLYRYEQVLRLLPSPEKAIIYCDENLISEKGYFIPNSQKSKPSELPFPYFLDCFDDFNENGILIPKSAWLAVGGLRLGCKEVIFEDFLLRLESFGCLFRHIPFTLYSTREYCVKKSAQFCESLLPSLEHYATTKKLDWKFTLGFDKRCIRPIPKLNIDHRIQVIIPYKNQKELTLKSVQSVLKQKDVFVKITAVDNQSDDRSIAEELRTLGCEVLVVNEAFNYSRLNNFAVKHTQTAKECDLILFLNNDVELEPDALLEMQRWIDQPHIGIVGCRLHYPDGRIQHAGIHLDTRGIEEMRWVLTDKLLEFEQTYHAKKTAVCDAVTAACALMKKRVFEDIGGFDETYYPIAFSDTNLSVKLNQKGLKCLYTPYAKGIHHESVSRKEGIEDIETSWWLHRLFLQHQKRN